MEAASLLGGWVVDGWLLVRVVRITCLYCWGGLGSHASGFDGWVIIIVIIVIIINNLPSMDTYPTTCVTTQAPPARSSLCPPLACRCCWCTHHVGGRVDKYGVRGVQLPMYIIRHHVHVRQQAETLALPQGPCPPSCLDPDLGDVTYWV